jgi:hypothetical protein
MLIHLRWRFIFTIILILPSANRLVAQLSWKEKAVTLTLVEGQQGAQIDFAFTNNSTEIIEISQVVTSCACTIAGDYTKIVAPQKTGAIRFFFNPGDKTGPFKQTMRVETGKHSADLTIQGEVLEWASITPRLLVWQRNTNTNSQSMKIAIAEGVETTIFPPQVEGVKMTVEKNGPENYIIKVQPMTLDKPLNISVPIRIQRANPDVIVVRNAFIVVR